MEQFSDQLLISDFSPCPRPRGYLRETGDFSYNTRACALAPPTSPDHGFFCTRAYDLAPSTSPDYGFFLQYPRMRSRSPSFTRLWVLLTVPAHAISLPLSLASRSWGFFAVNHLRFLTPTQSPQRSSGNLPELQARTLSLSPDRRPLPPML